MMILFIISCSIHTIAQTDYYYYKGNKIPLVANDNKICVSIPKDNEKTSERIRLNAKVLDKINDEFFDIFIFSRSEFEKLCSLDFWKEDAKSVLLTPSYRTTKGTEVFASPYLNLQLKKEEDINLLTAYAEDYGFNIVRQDSLMPLWYTLTITLDSGINSVECANKLWESGQFAASVPDLCSDDFICSNDPYFDLQWGLHNNLYPDIDISATNAWELATGKNIKIAIIDTGVDMNHKDLKSNISNLTYDTETGTIQTQLYGDHGTHCAGIAAAVKDNNIQIAGVAPEATIISISNSLAKTTDSQFNRAKGIIWAYKHGADIISNSWESGTHHDAIDIAIDSAFTYGRHGKGCVIVFSVGNDYSNSINYPANCNDMILAVGAIDSTGVRDSSSNYGTGLDLVAPGKSILSTLPNDTIGRYSGTSMVCPHVAGVAALILQRNSELTVSQVHSIICSNAKKLSNVNFNITKPDGSWNNKYGYGLVDAYNSVINTPDTVYIQNETITGTRVISGEKIYVGRNVTNTKPYGNVVLGQGNITMKAKYLRIKNSTTVPLGSTLTIEE